LDKKYEKRKGKGKSTWETSVEGDGKGLRSRNKVREGIEYCVGGESQG
jgi:hypothetical protein